MRKAKRLDDAPVSEVKPNRPGGLSSDPEKAENQLRGLAKGHKPKDNPMRSVDFEEALTKAEKKYMAMRRKQLEDRFRSEQFPLLDSYLRVEVLQYRAAANCASGTANTYDIKKLDDMTRLMLVMAESLQITPKEERKNKAPDDDALSSMLKRAGEFRDLKTEWEREEAELEDSREEG
jgi:hypothetical protein